METKRVHEVVHTLRQKPLHVRENIALGVSGGVTLLVALGWFGAMAAGGTFSLAPTTLATENPDVSHAVSASKDNWNSLLGAAGTAFSGSSSPAAITIVDTKTSSTLDEHTVPADQTVIHF